MAKSPAFQFYANDFITGTQDWSIEEVGIYIRLLCYQWDHGFIPEDKKRLSRIAGCDLESIEKAWVILGYKFLEFPDGLKNSRLEQTRYDQIKFREKQRLNGIQGGRPLKSETQTKPKQNPMVNPDTNPNKTSSSPSSNKEKNKKKIFLPPTLEEFKMYWIENGFDPNKALRAWTAYSENDWMDSKNNPVLNWKSKCQNVWFKDENKISNQPVRIDHTRMSEM